LLPALRHQPLLCHSGRPSAEVAEELLKTYDRQLRTKGYGYLPTFSFGCRTRKRCGKLLPQYYMVLSQLLHNSEMECQSNSMASARTHWYHAHKHGSTAINLLNGMAGALIIEGDYDDN